VNVAGAKAFLAFLASPAFQARLASYPNTRQPAFVAGYPPAKVTSAPVADKAGTKKSGVPWALVVAVVLLVAGGLGYAASRTRAHA
jgi:hypothetical protein